MKHLKTFTLLIGFFCSSISLGAQHEMVYVDSAMGVSVTFPLSDLSFLATNDNICFDIFYATDYIYYTDICITPDSTRYGFHPIQQYDPPDLTGIYKLFGPTPPFNIGFSQEIELITEDTLIQGMTCDSTGLIYLAGKGITTRMPPFTSNYLGDLPANLHCQGDLTIYNGKLYMVANGNKFVEVNVQNPALSEVVWEFTPDVFPIHSTVTFKIECDSSVTYAIGKAADYSVLYEIDYENQTLNEICDIPDKLIQGAASYSECMNAPCDIFIDLDADNSSGGIENDFVADTSCIPPISIVDEDVMIVSEPGKLDSITIALLDISDMGMEYLLLAFNSIDNIIVSGSGTNKIKLFDENGTAPLTSFEFALKLITYQNDASIPTNGTREVIITGYSTVYQSEPSRSYITLSNEVLQFNYAIDEPDCFGDNNGSLSIAPSGGIAPYSVEWFNTETDNSVTDLGQGLYSLTLTDAEGCQRADTVELMQPDSLIATIESANGNIVCDNSGELSAIGTGGTTSYSYLWNDGFTEQTNSQLSAGIHLVTITDANGCNDFAEYQLIEDTIFINQQEQLCIGETFDFNNETFISDTSLCVTFIAVNGCDSIYCLDLQFVDTTFTALFEEICFGENYDFNGLILENDTSLCQTYSTIDGCDSIICLNLTVLENITQLTDEFCEGEGYNFNGITLIEGGIYLDTFTAFNGCDSLIILDLQMNPAPVFSFEIEGNMCLDGEITVTFNPDNEYLWATGETTNVLTFTEPGIYNGIVTNNFTCSNEVAFTVAESSDIEIFYTTQSPACIGDLFGNILVDSIFGGLSPYLFALNGEPLQTNNQFENLLSGNYELLVEDANGCQATTNIMLSEPQPLSVDVGNNQMVNLGTTVNLSINTNVTNPIVQWSPSDYLVCDTCLITTAIPQQSIEYQVSITDENGCTVTDGLEIFVNDITGAYVPNVFSPNNDSINDYFYVQSDASIASISTFRIFDRWGGLLFESLDILPNDSNLGWDGIANDKIAGTGVYVYFIEVLRVDGMKEILKGEVLLVR